MLKTGGLLKSVHLFGKLTSFSPFLFTLCGVPVAGYFYWSSKRRHGAATHLEILPPIGTKAPVISMKKKQYSTVKI